LSEVQVPPVALDLAEVDAITNHDQARSWLEQHVYPSRQVTSF